jgi:hypothetical protein
VFPQSERHVTVEPVAAVALVKLQTSPSPKLRDSRLQRAIDEEVVASIVGTRAFVGGPGANWITAAVS